MVINTSAGLVQFALAQLVPTPQAVAPSMVKYKEFNLLSNPSSLGGFDVVFCRNALIYFDQKAKSAILERISRLLPPDGSQSAQQPPAFARVVGA